MVWQSRVSGGAHMDVARRICIYCGCDKLSGEFSLEHIWPSALGGSLCGDLFKTSDVCRQCNEKSGLWVDGEFLKSWFIKNEVALAQYPYLDPAVPAAISLVYLGIQTDLSISDGLVCERWVGPSGDHIYHFHAADENKWFGYAGGNIIARQGPDPGRAYIVLATQQRYWVHTALLSFAAHFSRAKRCCLTEVVGAPDSWRDLLPRPDGTDEIQARELALIRASGDKAFQANVPVRMDVPKRFLSKIALGLGFNLLGDAFLATPYALQLRAVLHESDAQKRAAMDLRASSYLQSVVDGPLTQTLRWDGAWVLVIAIISGTLSLLVSTPSGRLLAVAISDDSALWANGRLKDYQLGQAFLILPQRREFVGPVSLPEYVLHRWGTQCHAQLTRLEGLRVDPSRLPDKR